MKLLSALLRIICGVNSIVGKSVSWLSLGIVVTCFTVVVLRYLFSISFIWMQDLYVWLNGAMFTGVAAYALFRDDHVRVDIFYGEASKKKKAIADMIGVVVFLLPFMWVVLAYSMTFVSRSWKYMEASANVGGMPGLFVLKSFIILFAVLVALQGVAMLIRSLFVLVGREDLLPANYSYEAAEKHTPEEAV
ncbi:MAG: TRAP transporter small permease subunit [Rhodobacteraceae bacterium]|nr:TRAP transporter small permease subunit [Paracoccaceae bacterium]